MEPAKETPTIEGLRDQMVLLNRLDEAAEASRLRILDAVIALFPTLGVNHGWSVSRVEGGFVYLISETDQSAWSNAVYRLELSTGLFEMQ